MKKNSTSINMAGMIALLSKLSHSQPIHYFSFRCNVFIKSLMLTFFLVACIGMSQAQTTYDFSTNATIVNTGFWNTQANITVGGVAFKLTSGGNGGFANAATGGVGNSKCLIKDGSGGDLFTLERADGQPFQFYGFWVKHQSMNSYSQFFPLPPWYTITYNKTVGAPEIYTDNTPMQGGPSANTTSEVTFTKDLTVTSVTINFQAILYYWIDNIIVGPAVAPPAPAITVQPSDKSICAAANTTFSVTATNASTYKWQVNTGSGFTNLSNGAPYSGTSTRTLTITGATAAMDGYQYRVTATGPTSPAATSNAATLSVSSAMSLSGPSTNVSCNGGNNGTAVVNITGGASPYTYSWAPSGGTNATATGLAAGTYTVTVTDKNGCKATNNYTITQPAALNATATKTDVSCNGGSNGVASVSASGGTGAYTYSWAPSGGTAATATGLAAGVYTVTITDANSCRVNRSVTVTQPPAISLASYAQNNVACNGGSNGSASVTPSGGNGPYTYSWSPSGGTAATATGLAAGNYTVTVTDNNSCQATRNFTLTQPAAMTVTASQVNVSCNGGSNGSATVNVSGGTGSKTYSWAPTGGKGATATGLSAGTYTVTITDDNNCQTTQSFIITEPTAISATSTQTNVTCNGGGNGTASVVASGGTGSFTYSWSPSGGTAASATGLAAGTYTVTITDANNCEATQSVTITQPVAMAATTSQVNVSCNNGSNGSATVSVTGGTGAKTYSWSPSGGSAATASGLVAGVYTVTITDANNCQITKTVTITQPTAININSNTQTNVSCNGGSNGSVSVTVNGGAPGYTYSWSPGGGTTSTATGLAAGTYTVTVTDANNCTASKSFTVTQPPAMTVSMTATNVHCNGGADGSATATVSGGAGAYSYSWSPSGGTKATATGLSAGTYTVMVTDANECMAIQSVTITQPAPIAVTATPASQTICSGEATSIALASVPAGADFAWTVSEVSGDVSGAASGSGTAITQTLTGSGVVKYIVTPASSTCAGAMKEVLITVNALTTIEMQPANKSVYDEESVQFAVEANNASSYQWQVNTGYGFTDLIDDAHYSGANTVILKITDVTGAMNGNLYRVIATGKCAPVTSNSAELSVKVRTVQTISFAATDQKTYGDADYTPAATSNANLPITYSSSDASIVSIENGKIHIKRAGQVTITATQKGDDDYKPAADVKQELTITRKTITPALNVIPAISKTYDTETNIKLVPENYSLDGVVEGDDVWVSGVASFDNSNAGPDKTIVVNELTLYGESAENYQLSASTAEVQGSIKPADITVTLNASPNITKVYNGTDTAVLSQGNYTIAGVLGEDEVNIASSQAVYTDKNVGTDKEVTVTAFVLGGADAGNYNVVTKSATTSGVIQVKEISVSLADAPAISKVYDGNNKASVPAAKYQLEGLVPGDAVTVSGVAVYNNKNAGGDKSVSVNDLVLSGADAENYKLTTTELTTEGIVEKAILTVTVVTADVPIKKVYDGTTEAIVSADNYSIEGIVSDDDVQLNNPTKGAYDSKHGGSEKEVTVSELGISGEDAGNYELASTTVSSSIGIITPKVITVAADTSTKVYGQPDPVLTYVADGKLEGDTLPGKLSRTEGKDVGSYIIEQGTLDGGTDYEIESFEGASFSITRAALVVKADDQTKKQGTANPALTLSYEGLVEGDQAADLDTQAQVSTSAATESPIGYYDINVSGAVSSNYEISFVKGRLTVTPANGDNYSVKAWSSSPDMLQVRIFTTVAQKGAITLFTETGQMVVLQQHQLQPGINSISVPVGNLASSTYILSVNAEKFKDAQKVKIK